jgi:acetyl-CoA carboxylase biotin carboxyl carrier protein
MDIKDIRQLIRLMVDNGLSELDIEQGSDKVHLKRPSAEGQILAMPAVQYAAAPPIAAVAAPAAAAPAAAPAAPAEALLEVRSPMVGTFYAAPSPDSDTFVRVGAAVAEDTVVCIVEAMKVMNEIKAECRGTIVEVCVKNAQPVEYNQVLFRLRP